MKTTTYQKQNFQFSNLKVSLIATCYFHLLNKKMHLNNINFNITLMFFKSSRRRNKWHIKSRRSGNKPWIFFSPVDMGTKETERVDVPGIFMFSIHGINLSYKSRQIVHVAYWQKLLISAGD